MERTFSCRNHGAVAHARLPLVSQIAVAVLCTILVRKTTTMGFILLIYFVSKSRYIMSLFLHIIQYNTYNTYNAYTYNTIRKKSAEIKKHTAKYTICVLICFIVQTFDKKGDTYPIAFTCDKQGHSELLRKENVEAFHEIVEIGRNAVFGVGAVSFR